MTSVFVAAFLMGLIGSFHCVGMCGPLALALPVSHRSSSEKYAGIFLYNAGRVLTYSCFGLLIGYFGKSVKMAGLQQWLSIAGGCIILLYLLSSKFNFTGTWNMAAPFFLSIRKRIGVLFHQPSVINLFLIGILNGLLPCGFVYLAIAGAIATGEVTGSVLFMMGFGLGTIPMMWMVSFFGNMLGMAFSRGIRKIYPYTMALVAALLILRGMSLGVPYISPKIVSEKVHQCCHKH